MTSDVQSFSSETVQESVEDQLTSLSHSNHSSNLDISYSSVNSDLEPGSKFNEELNKWIEEAIYHSLCKSVSSHNLNFQSVKELSLLIGLPTIFACIIDYYIPDLVGSIFGANKYRVHLNHYSTILLFKSINNNNNIHYQSLYENDYENALELYHLFDYYRLNQSKINQTYKIHKTFFNIDKNLLITIINYLQNFLNLNNSQTNIKFHDLSNCDLIRNLYFWIKTILKTTDHSAKNSCISSEQKGVLQDLVRNLGTVARPARPAHPDSQPIAVLNQATVKQLVNSITNTATTTTVTKSSSSEPLSFAKMSDCVSNENIHLTKDDQNTQLNSDVSAITSNDNNITSNLSQTDTLLNDLAFIATTRRNTCPSTDLKTSHFFLNRNRSVQENVINQDNSNDANQIDSQITTTTTTFTTSNMADKPPFSRNQMYATFNKRPTPCLSNKLPSIGHPSQSNNPMKRMGTKSPRLNSSMDLSNVSMPSLRSEFEKRKRHQSTVNLNQEVKGSSEQASLPIGTKTWLTSNSSRSQTRKLTESDLVNDNTISSTIDTMNISNQSTSSSPSSSRAAAIRLSLDQRRRAIEASQQRKRLANSQATVNRNNAAFVKLLQEQFQQRRSSGVTKKENEINDNNNNNNNNNNEAEASALVDTNDSKSDISCTNSKVLNTVSDASVVVMTSSQVDQGTDIDEKYSLLSTMTATEPVDVSDHTSESQSRSGNDSQNLYHRVDDSGKHSLSPHEISPHPLVKPNFNDDKPSKPSKSRSSAEKSITEKHIDGPNIEYLKDHDRYVAQNGSSSSHEPGLSVSPPSSPNSDDGIQRTRNRCTHQSPHSVHDWYQPIPDQIRPNRKRIMSSRVERQSTPQPEIDLYDEQHRKSSKYSTHLNYNEMNYPATFSPSSTFSHRSPYLIQPADPFLSLRSPATRRRKHLGPLNTSAINPTSQSMNYESLRKTHSNHKHHTPSQQQSYHPYHLSNQQRQLHSLPYHSQHLGQNQHLPLGNDYYEYDSDSTSSSGENEFEPNVDDDQHTYPHDGKCFSTYSGRYSNRSLSRLSKPNSRNRYRSNNRQSSEHLCEGRIYSPLFPKRTVDANAINSNIPVVDPTTLDELNRNVSDLKSDFERLSMQQQLIMASSSANPSAVLMASGLYQQAPPANQPSFSVPTISSTRATWSDRPIIRDLGVGSEPAVSNERKTEGVEPILEQGVENTVEAPQSISTDQSVPQTKENAFFVNIDDNSVSSINQQTDSPENSEKSLGNQKSEDKNDGKLFFIGFNEPDPDRVQRTRDRLEARRATERALMAEQLEAKRGLDRKEKQAAERAYVERKMNEKEKREAVLQAHLSKKEVADSSTSRVSNPYPVRSGSSALSRSEINLSSTLPRKTHACKTEQVTNSNTIATTTIIKRSRNSDVAASLDTFPTSRHTRTYSLSKSVKHLPFTRGSADGEANEVNGENNCDSSTVRDNLKKKGQINYSNNNNNKLPSGVSLTSLHRLGSNESPSSGPGLPVQNLNQPKLFVKPKAKSNRSVIVNAIGHCCLAGTVNEPIKQIALRELASTEGTHFMILFRDSRCQYRAVYSFDLESEELRLICGSGPRKITHDMVSRFFKYNSGAKQFTEITSTKHLSAVVDAITIHDALWTKTGAQHVNSSGNRS